MRTVVLAVLLAAVSSSGCKLLKKGRGTPAAAVATVGMKKIDRAMYGVAYPDDWTLDEKDEDFDLDHFFSIDAPGNCHVSVFLFDTKIDAKQHLEIQTKKMNEKVFKDPATETPFSTWGSLSGTGVELHGRMKPVGKGRIRNFVHAEGARSVLTIEFCFDEELPKSQPGFDAIAGSFHFK